MNAIMIDKVNTEETAVATDKTDIFAAEVKETPKETPKSAVEELKSEPASPVESEKEKTDEAEVTEGVAEGEPTKVQWQCKYRRYQMVLSIFNSNGKKTKTGERILEVIKARNWRIPLDLSVPKDLAIHKELLASPQCGNEFMLLKDTKKAKGDLIERGLTLTKLMDMPDDQLMGMLDDDEMEEAGLVPGVHQDRMQLILAIIDAKKFQEKGGEQK